MTEFAAELGARDFGRHRLVFMICTQSISNPLALSAEELRKIKC